jgi:hypothetical protein
MLGREVSPVYSEIHTTNVKDSLWAEFGAFAKLRKATISFAVSVCPHGTIRFQPDGFS